MKLLSCILALIAGFVAAPLAAADDLIISRAVLVDAAGTLTIADVAGREFAPAGPTLSAGYTQSVYWLRLRVRAPAKGTEVVLRISPTYLDEVRLFEADAGPPEGWKTRVTGDRYAYAERDHATIRLRFLVTLNAPEATYYLRLETASPLWMNVEALSPGEADRNDFQLDLLGAIFLATMLWALGWAIHDYVVDHQPIVGLFCLHQVVYILWGFTLAGYFAPLVPDNLPQLADWFTDILICGRAFVFLLFSRALFKLYSPPPAALRGLDLLLAVFPLQLAAITLGEVRLTMAGNAVLIVVEQWYFVLVAFVVRQESVPSRRFLRVTYVVLALLVTVFQFGNLGWIEIAQASRRITMGLIVHGIIGSSLIVMMLYARSRQLRHDAQQSALDLALSQQALALEQKHKELAELQARTDYLTGLFNRRHFVELAEREVARAVRYQSALTLLMVDVDRFKEVNDTWGHSVGDAVLQQVAHLIRDVLRDVDLVGRIGGEEFAIVLVETDGEHAMDIARRLCATVADATFFLPEGRHVQVTVSVGLTELKGRNTAFDVLLREADRSLYRAKESGRNRVVISE